MSGSTVYAGGYFYRIGGQARTCLAALDAATGSATSWKPDPAGDVFALSVNGSTVYAGGTFRRIAGLPQSYFAAFAQDVPTPALLSLVSAQALADRVDLTWLAPARDVTVATVYRRTEASDWQALGPIAADGIGRLIYLDTRVTAGTRYGYRLGVMEPTQEVFRGETWVEVPVGPVLALAGSRSNPARGDLGIAFTLPDASPATLELFDVSGRRIDAREVGSLGAGSHVVALGTGRALPSGVYLLRLSRGGRALTARAAILK